jgi:ABC-type spermidine/putrescine transport system permease subunit II
MIGAFLSGFTYTYLYGFFQKIGNPEAVWYVIAAHLVLGVVVVFLFMSTGKELKELEE